MEDGLQVKCEAQLVHGEAEHLNPEAVAYPHARRVDDFLRSHQPQR